MSCQGKNGVKYQNPTNVEASAASTSRGTFSIHFLLAGRSAALGGFTLSHSLLPAPQSVNNPPPHSPIHTRPSKRHFPIYKAITYSLPRFDCNASHPQQAVTSACLSSLRLPASNVPSYSSQPHTFPTTSVVAHPHRTSDRLERAFVACNSLFHHYDSFFQSSFRSVVDLWWKLLMSIGQRWKDERKSFVHRT